ncbi:MAG: hypoxanthine phosphoribosyltransferase [Anaerolineae bacterium]|nr:hypoxanthine phosphoribosyltransferase [Anaerolineae bacterium]
MLIDDIAEVLITAEEIQKRVAELGRQISADYEGRDLLLIAVLKGGVLFLSDLMRHITVPHAIDFMAISSYGLSTETTGVVRILKDLDEPIDGRHVLIVEDIVDTGRTMDYLLRILQARHPASLRVCTLLNKPGRREIEVPLDYVGFDIPNRFVFGYGLDLREIFRNQTFIAALKPEAQHALSETAQEVSE